MTTQGKHWDKTDLITRIFKEVTSIPGSIKEADDLPKYMVAEIVAQDVNRIACAMERIADALEHHNVIADLMLSEHQNAQRR